KRCAQQLYRYLVVGMSLGDAACAVSELDPAGELHGVRQSIFGLRQLHAVDVPKRDSESGVIVDVLPSDTSVTLERDFQEASVEGAINERGQTNPVAGIQPDRGVL